MGLKFQEFFFLLPRTASKRLIPGTFALLECLHIRPAPDEYELPSCYLEDYDLGEEVIDGEELVLGEVSYAIERMAEHLGRSGMACEMERHQVFVSFRSHDNSLGMTDGLMISIVENFFNYKKSLHEQNMEALGRALGAHRVVGGWQIDDYNDFDALYSDLKRGELKEKFEYDWNP